MHMTGYNSGRWRRRIAAHRASPQSPSPTATPLGRQTSAPSPFCDLWKNLKWSSTSVNDARREGDGRPCCRRRALCQTHQRQRARGNCKSVPIFRPIRLAAIQSARPHHRHIFHFIDLLASSSSLPPCITLYPHQEQSGSYWYCSLSIQEPQK